MPFDTVDGVEFYYEIHGKGNPLVFIHGLGSSVADWENQRDYFARSFQVILIDLRGHGQSGKPDNAYTMTMFASDIATLLGHIIPNEPAVIIGHSLGGMIAYELAINYSRLVEKLVIINSYPAVIFATKKAQFDFWLRQWSIKLFGMHYLAKILASQLFPEIAQEALREKFIQRWSDNDPDAYIRALHAFPGWNVISSLDLIQCPVLLVCADQDYTPLSIQEKLLTLIPHVNMVTIKNSRHMTPWDQPVMLNQILQDFLE